MLNKTQALATADDLATLIVIDIFCLGIKTHKINTRISECVVNRTKFEDIINKQLNEFLSGKKSAINTAKLLLQYINVHLPNIKIPSSRKLLDQLKFYLRLIHVNSGFIIQTCFRYVLCM